MRKSSTKARIAPLGRDPTAYLNLVAEAAPLFGTAWRVHREGHIAKARSIYLELMEQPALTAACLHQLGVVAGQQGDHKRAAALLLRAIRIDPSQPMFYQNLAFSLEQQGNKEGALDALIDLATSLQKNDQHEEAIPLYRKILAADPCRYAAQCNLGTGLTACHEPRAAIPHLIRGVALHAELMPELKGFLADILPRLVADGVVPGGIAKPPGRPTGRVNLLQYALTSLGKAAGDLGYADEAVRSFRMAIAIEPGIVLGHWNYSLQLLRNGDYANGWKEYEWRWRWDKFPDPPRHLPAPRWRGEPLAGKTIVVFAEQGYGDAIQFAPLATRVAEQAGAVLLEVTTPLVRLFRESFEGGNIAVLERTNDPHRVATKRAYDYVVPMMSLPDRFGLEIEDLPLFAHPYLKPAPADNAAWAERLAAASGLKVGLAWAGRPTHGDDHKRSMTLERLRPLFELEGISWHSLQVGPSTAQLAAANLPIADLSSALKDFADTTAATAQLDLVITVDTVIAHIAGALGKPVWLMLPAIAEWRWLREGSESPWYPTARLFRQPAIGDWDSLVAEVKGALASLAPQPKRRQKR